MSGAQYLVLTNVYVAVFIGFYFLFLKKQTFFQLNRIYLLSSLALSFVVPLIQTHWATGLGFTRDIRYTIELQTVTVTGNQEATQGHITAIQLITRTYFAGIAVGAAWLLYRLFLVRRFLGMNNGSSSYSFFKKIHIGNAHLGEGLINEHEQAHAAQWHSADILFVEIVAILSWFNPAIYLYRKELKTIHEFIADEQALKSATSKGAYAMLLLSQTFEIPINNLVNTFFNQNLLKQRIMMIQKNRSTKKALLRYGLLLPVFGMMLILSSATVSGPAGRLEENSTRTQSKPQDKDRVFTMVDQEPTFRGGENKFAEFLGKNIKYPKAMKEKGVHGKVFLSFIVEKDGSLTNFKILKDIGYGAGKEALRVLAMSPKWNPGLQNGKKVRVQFTIPVSYALENAKVKS